MNTVYKVVRVYKGSLDCEFYVVNSMTRKVQSVWIDLVDANRVMITLNANEKFNNMNETVKQ